mmetsp:Transcript_64756/g.173466  ORF Transcript_64756/g.173466 Transcript_64756/m.173466 type:complete len:321 (+) Transcript_64756:1305-2267(+)
MSALGRATLLCWTSSSGLGPAATSPPGSRASELAAISQGLPTAPCGALSSKPSAAPATTSSMLKDGWSSTSGAICCSTSVRRVDSNSLSCSKKKRHKLCASELLLCNSNLSNTISQDFGAPSFRQLSLRCQQFRNPLVSLDSQQKLVSADESLLLLFIFKLSEQVAEVVVKRTVLIFILILEANTTPMHTCIPCFDRQVNANCRNWKMCTILKLSSKKWTAPSDPFRHVHAPLVIVTPSGNMQYHLHNFGARTWNKRLCPSHILWTVHQHIFQQSEQRARQFGGFCPRRRLKRMQSRFLNGIQCLLKQYQHNPPCKLKLT